VQRNGNGSKNGLDLDAKDRRLEEAVEEGMARWRESHPTANPYYQLIEFNEQGEVLFVSFYNDVHEARSDYRRSTHDARLIDTWAGEPVREAGY
jgi:hypothetical protein